MIPQLLLSIGLIFMVSCSDSSSNSTEPDPIPNPPSASAMAIDLSIFTSEAPDSNAAGDHSNYEAAAISISSVQAVMNRNVNLAVDLLASADTANAQELSDTKWQWTYTNDEQEGRLIYEVRLVAQQQSANELKWDLFLDSPALPSGEMHYISGTTNRDVTEGEWTYYSFGRAGQPSQEMAELNWEIDGNQNVDMQLQLLAGNNFEGSQMNYQTNGANRMIVLAPSEDGETTIEFNTETNAGFIIAPDYNKGEKACWDSNFENTECPAS